jgi:hypothetical protein
VKERTPAKQSADQTLNIHELKIVNAKNVGRGDATKRPARESAPARFAANARTQQTNRRMEM